jgi:hypothetical protein
MIFLHLLLTVVRTLVTEHDVERFFIAGVHQYVEDELVELGNVLRADRRLQGEARKRWLR